MFRWYQNAARCYVYLSDISDSVLKNGNQQSESIWPLAFRKSKWFTRGWTLQELIAPASVEFFTKDGLRLGDKRTLEQEIHEITNIAVPALRGTDLSTFTVEERFKWAETRQTTLDEDWAYSLLGIFGTFMPLIYGEGKSNAIRRLRKEISDTTRRDDALSSQAADSCTSMVPFERNPSFTSRETDLEKIRQILFTGQQTAKVAISGLGGVGKTQLALELAYRIRAEYKDCSVIWIPTTSKESLEQAYLNTAAKLGISGSQDAKVDVKRLVQDHLSSENAGRWLLVFDNADDVGLWIDKPSQESRSLIDYIPKSVRGSVLFTTRDKKTAVRLAGRNVVEISEMSEADGKQLLEKYLVDQDLVSQGDVKALLVRLTYLPLAIVQAAVEDFEDEGRYHDVKNPIATTWLISFDKIRQSDPLAAEYLSFMACVDAKDIPQSLLPPGQSRKKEIEAMGTLQGYSFITKRPADSVVTIHRLVHLAIRNWLRKEGILSQWAGKTIVRLATMMGDVDYGTRAWRSYMPHAYYVLESTLVSEDDDDKLDLLDKDAISLYYDGRYQEAETVFERAMEAHKMKSGADHPNTLISMGGLASVYRKRGRWKEAEKLEVQVVDGLKLKRGADHIETLNSMGNLASTYRRQGRWDEAERLEQQVMDGLEMTFGADHPETLISMSKLAAIYWYQSRWEEAEKLYTQVMETGEVKIGADHPETLNSMANLSFTYHRQGRLDEAETLALHAMNGLKKKAWR
ncbi:hypothetical protein V8C42DRAFT_298209 [Trichoderma barbatum]